MKNVEILKLLENNIVLIMEYKFIIIKEDINIQLQNFVIEFMNLKRHCQQYPTMHVNV